MASYWSDSDHIKLFSLGFDLIRGELPELMIAEIVEEIEDNPDIDTDDRDVALALDALYAALDEYDEAICVDSRQTMMTDSSLFTLREARHQFENDDPGEAYKMLEEVIRLDKKVSSVRQLCTLLAYGRKNDRESFARKWDELLTMYDIKGGGVPSTATFFSGKCSLLGELPFREHIEGIVYLYAFDIPENREAEVLDLITCFQLYINRVTQEMYNESVIDGFTDSLPALGVIAAIASGMEKEIAHILKNWDPFDLEEMTGTVGPAIVDIRKTQAEMLVLDTLKRWSFSHRTPTPELVSSLKEQSGGDNEIVIDMVDLLSSERPRTDYRPIRALFPGADAKEPVTPVNQKATGKKSRKSRSIPHNVWDNDKIDDSDIEAWGLADDESGFYYDEDDDDEDDGIDALKLLLKPGHEQDAYEYLLGEIVTGHLIEQYSHLFDLAWTLGRMNELPGVRAVFESWGMKPAIHLLDAYDRLVKRKDLKGGLALVERAEKAGLSRDDSLLFSARFLLEAGYPKRVLGLCGKMDRSDVGVERYYPLLIQAYWDLGRLDEAACAEERLREILS